MSAVVLAFPAQPGLAAAVPATAPCTSATSRAAHPANQAAPNQTPPSNRSLAHLPTLVGRPPNSDIIVSPSNPARVRLAAATDLTPTERQLLTAVLGADDRGPRTVENVARTMGVSAASLAAPLRSGLAKLRVAHTATSQPRLSVVR